MRQSEFEARGEARWRRLEAALAAGRKADPEVFVADYQGVCRDLSLATERGYSASLQARLNHLALAGHNILHGSRTGFLMRVARFVRADFPRAVRAEWRVVTCGMVALFGPMLVAIVLIWLNGDAVYAFLDAGTVADIESMYDPDATRVGRARDAGSDVGMFGFYIYNNIGIAFRCFAAGLLFTVGSLLILIFNGTTIGAVIGHLGTSGFGGTLFPFIAGHGAFELTAIALSGAAGMRLGLALLNPGPMRRAEALRRAGGRAFPVIAGAAGMLLIAAFIEAFWSPRTSIPAAVKYTVGASLWALVIGYLVFAGRGRDVVLDATVERADTPPLTGGSAHD